MAEEEASHPFYEGRANSFEAFLPFISTSGLSPADGKRFQAFLRGLYSETGQHWRPGRCHRVFTYIDTAKKSVSGYFKSTPQFGLYHADDFSHFWLSMNLPGTPEMVIDPAGYLVPYFGPKSPAQGDSSLTLGMKDIYAKGIKYSPQEAKEVIAHFERGVLSGGLESRELQHQKPHPNATPLKAAK